MPPRVAPGNAISFVALTIVVLLCAGPVIALLGAGIFALLAGRWADGAPQGDSGAETAAGVVLLALLIVGIALVVRLIVAISRHMLARRETPETSYGGLLGDVSALLRVVAERELTPRFRALEAHQIREKSPGEVVTEADLASERALEAGLRRLFSLALVVGEEAATRDPHLLDDLARHEIALVVDPLDGTSQFAAGEEPFGIIVALFRHGRVDAGWIHLAHSGRTLFARRGHGAWLDGQPVRIPEAPPLAAARGAVSTTFMPAGLKPVVEAATASLNTGEPHRCAAQRYLDIVLGVEHFALYYRTLPWDHAAGALIVEEAGGVARRYDGSEYVAADVAGAGLLVAASPALWTELHAHLLPGIALTTRPE